MIVSLFTVGGRSACTGSSASSPAAVSVPTIRTFTARPSTSSSSPSSLSSVPRSMRGMSRTRSHAQVRVSAASRHPTAPAALNASTPRWPQVRRARAGIGSSSASPPSTRSQGTGGPRSHPAPPEAGRRVRACRPPHRPLRWPWSAGGCARTSSTSPTTSRPSTATASGPSCSPTTGAPVCARWGTVRPATPWPGRPWHGPPIDAWTTSLDEAAYCDGVRAIRASIAAGDVYQVNLCRVLAAPLPPDADVAALGAALAEGNPAPYSAVVRLPAPRDRGRLGVARAVPADRRPPRRVQADQGHGGRAGRLPPQGPRRERDDRRPRAQRPRAGVRVGIGRGAEPAGGRAPPGPPPPGVHRSGPASARLWLGRGDRRPPSRRGRSPARRSSPPSPPSTGWRPRRGRSTAGPWAGSTPTAATATSTSPSARSGSARATPGEAALRHRRRDHVGLDARGRVGRDRAEGPPTSSGSPAAWWRRDGVRRHGSGDRLVDLDGRRRPRRRPRRSPPATGASRP